MRQRPQLRSFIRIAFIVKTGEYFDEIGGRVDDKIEGIGEFINFQGTNIFVSNGQQRGRF